ncbi:MAG: PP2C family protein-serine/threonine phosphatase [Henriciella sp.]
MSLDWAATSVTGKVRPSNEDSYASLPDRGVWAVADGMGGGVSGGLASTLVCDAIQVAEFPDEFDEKITVIRDVLTRTNERILFLRPGNDNRLCIGTTIAVLVIQDHLGAVIWAGDSRIHRVVDGNLTQMTQDHSLVAEFVRQGQIKEWETRDHPDAHIISRGVGLSPDLELDMLTFEVGSGDRFLLSTDGVSNEIESDQLAMTLASAASAEDCNDRLMAQVMAGPAQDNSTAISVFIG